MCSFRWNNISSKCKSKMSYSYYLTSKWSKGEEVEKSIRKSNNESSGLTTAVESASASASVSTSAESESGFTRQANKRDAFNEMLSHRDLHTQVGQNPFLAGEHYLQHLNVQENYLRPQNTNVIEPKNNS